MHSRNLYRPSASSGDLLKGESSSNRILSFTSLQPLWLHATLVNKLVFCAFSFVGLGLLNFLIRFAKSSGNNLRYDRQPRNFFVSFLSLKSYCAKTAKHYNTIIFITSGILRFLGAVEVWTLRLRDCDYALLLVIVSANVWSSIISKPLANQTFADRMVLITLWLMASGDENIWRLSGIEIILWSGVERHNFFVCLD